MSSPNKIDLEMDFAAGVYLSAAQDPPLTHCTYSFIQYTYSQCISSL